MNRRELLAQGGLAALALGLPQRARAFGTASRFDVAELRLDRGTVSRPSAWKRLLYEVQHSTSVEVEPRAVLLAPEDPELFAHPFCVLSGDDALPELTPAQAEQVLRYLSYGGFLLVDDATGRTDGPFARSARALCARLFPTRPLAPLPADHSIYRAFFLLDRPYGRTDAAPVLDGVTLGPVTPLVFCPNDLGGALERAPNGSDSHPVVPGGESQRREALKLAVNLVIYSLTSNYKHDIAHVMELMREGRLE